MTSNHTWYNEDKNTEPRLKILHKRLKKIRCVFNKTQWNNLFQGGPSYFLQRVLAI